MEINEFMEWILSGQYRKEHEVNVTVKMGEQNQNFTGTMAAGAAIMDDNQVGIYLVGHGSITEACMLLDGVVTTLLYKFPQAKQAFKKIVEKHASEGENFVPRNQRF